MRGSEVREAPFVRLPFVSGVLKTFFNDRRDTVAVTPLSLLRLRAEVSFAGSFRGHCGLRLYSDTINRETLRVRPPGMWRKQAKVFNLIAYCAVRIADAPLEWA